MISLSFRLLRRDWRSGELRVLLIALLIAVTCVTSVSFFTNRISQALIYQSSELLGADLRLVSDHPINASAFNIARKDGLKSAETRSFRSMIMAEGHAQLVEIKAAGAGYPLRGHLRIATDQFSQDMATNSLPKSGEVWVSSRLLQQFGLSVGDRVQVGKLLVRITAVLTFEPDRSGNMFSLAPRLLMNLEDLPATGLEQEGSRIRYMLLVAGEQKQVKKYRQQMKINLGRGERIEGASDARREIRVALSRAQQFLGLAAVVAVVLACVAIAMAARRFSQRHLDTCAIMRCFGARQSQLTTIFVIQLIVLGLFTGLLGVLAGYFAQSVLAKLLGGLLLVKLPQPSAMPVLIGLGVSFGGLMGFALPPILRLRNVPTMRVLNRDSSGVSSAIKPVTMTSYLLGLAALAVLVLIQAGNLKLGFWLLSGLVGTALVLWIVSALLVRGLKHIARHGSSAWRFGLVNLTRRTNTSIIQVMAFGVGLMVLLLLTVVRGDLLRGWAQSIPPDAPNRFVINIQPDQLTAVKTFFKQKGLETATLYPMVRGRLIEINGKPVSAKDYQDQRTKRLVDREFNLSWAEKLQKDNKIVAGHWWSNDYQGKHFFSVEAEIAKAIGIKVGDSLTYNIAGQKFTAKVTSLRKVEWDTMRANFFVLASPGALNGYPQSYITSFYLPNKKSRYLDEMVKRFPNLTVIDIGSILSQIRLIIERVSMAVEYVFAFTLAAGLTVMYAAIQSTLDERLRENAILRALGAQRRRLWKSLAAEFVTLGSLAGLLAALTAGVVGFAIAHYVLNLEYVANHWLWLAGLLSGGIGVGIAGMLGTRRVLKSPPLAVLRRG
jgi:putative ABC transport system permease protein